MLQLHHTQTGVSETSRNSGKKPSIAFRSWSLNYKSVGCSKRSWLESLIYELNTHWRLHVKCKQFGSFKSSPDEADTRAETGRKVTLHRFFIKDATTFEVVPSFWWLLEWSKRSENGSLIKWNAACSVKIRASVNISSIRGGQALDSHSPLVRCVVNWYTTRSSGPE